MNLTLHGLTAPNISLGNTLKKDVREIEDDNQYDLILANPPFGGKEEKLVQKNFPFQYSETAILFLQHIEKSLNRNGRAGVVVSTGVLENDSYKNMRQDLLENSNVHSIVQLPVGTFYKKINTSVIFFDKKKSKTKEVWFYQVSLKEGETLKPKGNPIADKHFEELKKIIS